VIAHRPAPLAPLALPALLAAAPLLLAAGCLDPLVADTPAPADTILPAGSILPAVDDDPELLEELEEYDGVDELVPRITAFAGCATVHTWDLGPAPAFVAPIYFLVRRTGDTFTPVAHNTLVDALPGDPGYSPYWASFRVVVTDRYAGEVFPSVASLDEAEARGLIERPAAQPFALDCPIVAGDVRLEVGGGQPPLAPQRHANVKGRTVAYFDFGPMTVADDGVHVDEVRRYQVRREGGEPLSEPVRNVDLTGDGDTGDSNDVYERAPVEARPVPRCRTVEVAVPADTASIDTSHDETLADIVSADQLFTPAPVAGTVLAFHVTDDVRHCVIQRSEGGP
jgi:hypothetical protein